MTFDVRNRDFESRVRASFARQGFMEFIGANLQQVTAGAVEIQLSYKKEFSQQHGFFHGGLIGTLADNAGGYAAFTLMAASDSVLTVEYKLNLMAPAFGDLLIARGRVLRAGKNLTVCQSDIYVARNNGQKHCATMLGTFMTMAGLRDEPNV